MKKKPFKKIVVVFVIILSIFAFNIIFVSKDNISVASNTKNKITKTESVSDSMIDARDGKKYKIVKIGNQIWMAQNLAYKAQSGCWAYDDDESNIAKYGYLYSWETAKTACPAGWHIPSDAEWTQLITFLGGATVSADKLKETGTSHWFSPNTGATNESKFFAIPGGYRDYEGVYDGIGSSCYWWSSTENNIKTAWYRSVSYYPSGVRRNTFNKTSGFSIRCVKD